MSESLKEKFIAKLKAGGKFNLRNCSICNYKLGFVTDTENELYYDAGCDCVNYEKLEPRDWSDLDFYLDPKHGHVDRIEKWLNE